MKGITVYVTITSTGKRTVRTRKFDAATLARHGMTQEAAVLNWKAARKIAGLYEQAGN